ncbi:MAG: hypothetical protein KTR27_12240 [Leptolyngbyaceae cyanobacterium MAG.088]|nr:hypothetical protein [Leptolyngbyaceae cyanobacterium MAG.088]
MGYRLLGGVTLLLLLSGGQGIAQSYPDCPPPAGGEYLLLVRGDDETTRDRTISLLPVDKPTLVCSYLGDPVVRAGGFNSLEVANSWALYLNDIEGLNTVVVESSTLAESSDPVSEPVDVPTEAPPADESVDVPVEAPADEPVDIATPLEVEPTIAQPTPVPENSPDPEPVEVAAVEAPEIDTTGDPQYQPTLLGEGVAVLVDYQQNPELGRDLAQQGNVGLAVYLQQPYLLVMHTTDSSAAAAKLQQLVDRGLTSFLVDGQQVIRLTDTIR